MTHDDRNTEKILIVDDVPQNIQVLANILKEAGYQLGFARDGQSALAHTDSTQFDLILLDIMMPEVDGYEVCARLKGDKRKKDIPIIFITAKDATEDKTRGFEMGAVDYITKPFDAREVLARVKTHLTIRNYTIRLEQMVEEKTSQLIHADRLATLGSFSAAIVHEVNNPVSYIIGNARLMEEFWKSAESIVAGHADEDKTGQVGREAGQVQEWLKFILDGSYRISRLVKSLKTYSRQNYTQKRVFSLLDIINDALNLVGYTLKRKSIQVEVTVPSDLMIYGDQQKMSQALVNLINNACEAIENRDGRITIRAFPRGGKIDIRIRDNGPGVPAALTDKIFDPFFTTKGKDKGTGLGLSIVNTIMAEHQGKVVLLPSEGCGTEFQITIPLVYKSRGSEPE